MESRSMLVDWFATSTCRYVNRHTPPLFWATAWILPRPRGPDMGMIRFAFPLLPFTCVSPEMSQSGLIGSPIRSRT